jgi:hypothetical protein
MTGSPAVGEISIQMPLGPESSGAEVVAQAGDYHRLCLTIAQAVSELVGAGQLRAQGETNWNVTQGYALRRLAPGLARHRSPLSPRGAGELRKGVSMTTVSGRTMSRSCYRCSAGRSANECRSCCQSRRSSSVTGGPEWGPAPGKAEAASQTSRMGSDRTRLQARQATESWLRKIEREPHRGQIIAITAPVF